MQILETALYFIIVLGVLVFVHELGHFLAAKLFRMRVERFSIGFPPRAFGKQIGETDYCVSWVPIGGYVKIAGMIDESFDTDFLQKEPQPWEFRAKPIWQRIIVLSAGVVMNILLAIAIFWGINVVQGKTVRDTTRIGFVQEGSAGAAAGIQIGDSIVAINGAAVTTWEDLIGDVFIESMSGDVTLNVLRGGRPTTLVIPKGSLPESDPGALGISPAKPGIRVTSVESGNPADSVGIRPGDIVVRLAGEPVSSDSTMIRIVRAHAMVPLAIEWKRGDTLMSATVIPTAQGRIGIGFDPLFGLSVRRVQYSFFEALPQAVVDVVDYTALTVEQIWNVITRKTEFSQSVGGPIRIAQLATQTAELGILPFLWFMAVLSISLAFLNILPFPALDGGHILILLIEGVIGRELPVKVKLGIQRAGFFLLIAFMVFVLYNDIMKF
ncbi:MAG: rseP [Bacteroidetes bacterium]|nr:rseP [Bacteroidota bacterium]